MKAGFFKSKECDLLLGKILQCWHAFPAPTCDASAKHCERVLTYNKSRGRRKLSLRLFFYEKVMLKMLLHYNKSLRDITS